MSGTRKFVKPVMVPVPTALKASDGLPDYGPETDTWEDRGWPSKDHQRLQELADIANEMNKSIPVRTETNRIPPVDRPQSSSLQASDFRRLAQYLISATVQLQNGISGRASAGELEQLDPDAQALLREWVKASDHLRKLLLEFDGSIAATATKRAIGMLTRPQLARDEAAEECAALLTDDEPLKNALADGRWDEAGEQIAAAVIHRYLMALERGQE